MVTNIIFAVNISVNRTEAGKFIAIYLVLIVLFDEAWLLQWTAHLYNYRFIQLPGPGGEKQWKVKE